MAQIDLLDGSAGKSLNQVPVSLLAGKTILITGSSGLIGTHFLFGLRHCQKHMNLNMDVYAVTYQKIPNHFKVLKEDNHIKFLRGDLADNNFLKKIPKANIIIHLATYGQPKLFTQYSLQTLKLNTVVSLALFEKLVPEGQFLFASSSEIYSGLENSPFHESQIGTTNPTHPRSCYIEAKRCGEAICNAYRSQGVDAKSVRLSLAYGPGTRANDYRVINDFIQKGLCDKAIYLRDQGKVKRTYCYVTDAVNMVWRVLLEGEKAVYNTAGISTTTIANLAYLIGSLMKVPVFIPDKGNGSIKGAPNNVQLDLSAYTKEFGERTFINLRDGISRTIEWQRYLYQ